VIFNLLMKPTGQFLSYLITFAFARAFARVKFQYVAIDLLLTVCIDFSDRSLYFEEPDLSSMGCL